MRDIEQWKNQPLPITASYMKASLDVFKEGFKRQLSAHEEDHSAVHLTDGRFLVEERGVEIRKTITRSVVRHDLPPRSETLTGFAYQRAECAWRGKGVKHGSLKNRLFAARIR